MKTRTIGKSDLKVFPIGLGSMGMSEFYGKTDEKQSIKTLHKALDIGVNFIDTADVYGIGDNEELLRKAYSDRWNDLVLATKFGFVRDKNNPEVRQLNGSPEYVKSACEASLKRLGREAIDLYYLHRVDPNTPIEETVGAMAELVKEGKVRYIGLSEVSGDTLRRAHKVHPITAVQTEYSIWSRDVEQTTMSVIEELGISLVPYSPLGRGFLSGTIKDTSELSENDFRHTVPRFQKEFFESNKTLLSRIEQLADKKNVTPAQLSLAWLLHKGENIIPIPGTKHEKYLIENAKAVDVELTQEEMQYLDDTYNTVAGERYNANGMKFTNL
ncbi:aryl-alcohol dehydrogenase-like predicted oxidoreductase [Arcticibacter tournemirensis]|uniref:Aldo/keto reductase n=2 Tax=Bacteroidota TaxID=976 RepID=A0A5M9GJI4_9SPHI|nr:MULTISPECIES: aldo/keto reductase [Bacteroidota]KAA8474470.1 aldo/keto reductase [Arcticibacter tournemirensis]TQM49622.1 aryl-alcohol dehydrogenase-like predicted oxidoreductase [Arcticibacter tournemirensis]SEI89431.1 Predicted oxidoreductase [Myroides marinus]